MLGIESTAHTLGIAAVRKNRGKGRIEILSNQICKYPSSKKGYHPRKLADFHAKNFSSVLKKTLSTTGLKLKDFDAIAYSYGPGLGPCLQIGFVSARALSNLSGKPLLAVNHAVSHALAVKMASKALDPLVVYVSGGNTQIFFESKGKLLVIGETMDLGIGNFLDLLGRTLGLTVPDAVGVLTQASQSSTLVDLPYVVMGMNTSYSGLLTFIERLHEKNPTISKKDLCYSAQETAFAALCEASERALLHSGKKEVLLCGGNARNKRLQEMMKLMAQGHGAKFCCAKDELLGDNATMIAFTGIAMLENGVKRKELAPAQDVRVDEEKISYWNTT